MKVLGVIAEYNPFHNGHLLHLEKSKNIVNPDFTVAVMSGNITQRGDMAIWDKWTRASDAVRSGVDLVLEMPVVFSCSSAESFARGGISVLNDLGIVTHISFGSECGKTEPLQIIADLKNGENEEYEKLIKKYINRGMSYPVASEKAILNMLGETYADIIKTPNNILAIEYLKQLKIQKTEIIPVTIKRQGDAYSDTEIRSKYPGAGALRNCIVNGECCNEYLPYDIDDRIYGRGKKRIEDDILFKLISSAILTLSEKELSDILSVDEGIENRLKLMVRKSDSYNDFISNLTSKRYTSARIRRMCMCILLNIRKDSFDVFRKAEYSRILAFNDNGRRLLRLAEKTKKLKLINNVKRDFSYKENHFGNFDSDIKATDIYNLIKGRDMYMESEYLRTPRLIADRNQYR